MSLMFLCVATLIACFAVNASDAQSPSIDWKVDGISLGSSFAVAKGSLKKQYDTSRNEVSRIAYGQGFVSQPFALGSLASRNPHVTKRISPSENGRLFPTEVNIPTGPSYRTLLINDVMTDRVAGIEREMDYRYPTAPTLGALVAALTKTYSEPTKKLEAPGGVALFWYDTSASDFRVLEGEGFGINFASGLGAENKEGHTSCEEIFNMFAGMVFGSSRFAWNSSDRSKPNCGRFMYVVIQAGPNDNGVTVPSVADQRLVDYNMLRASRDFIARALEAGKEQDQLKRDKITPPPF